MLYTIAFRRIAGFSLIVLTVLFTTRQTHARPNYNLEYYAYLPISETEGCWGYVDSTDGNREYALICAVDRLEIYDISDPNFPALTATIPAFGFDLKQVRPYRNYLFAVNQFGYGLQIVDVSNVPNASTVATYSTQSSNGGAHTVHIDGNYAYLAVNGTVPASWRILDISNPTAPVEVGSYLTSLSSGFVQSHDSYIKGDTAYVAFLSGGFSVVDISNKAAPVRLADVYYPNAFTHNCWTTEDGKYLFTTDETPQGPSVPSGYLHVWDVQKPESIRLVAEWKSPSPGAIIHNVQVKGNYLYVSHYTDGVVILDVADPTQPVEVAHYDTAPDDSSGGFSGCWDFFPYFPSGVLLASNLSSSEGMWLLRFDSAKAGFLQGAVTNWATGEGLGNVNIRFVDYWRQVKTDTAGNFLVRTEGGDVRVEFFKEGFRPETVTVGAVLGDTTKLADTVRLVPMTEFPAAPAGLSARPDSVGNIYLSWLAPPDGDLSRFQIYRTTLGDTANFSLFDSVDHTVTSYTDPGANAGERFGYRVTAVDSGGLESFPSPPARTMRFVFGNKVLLVDRTRYFFEVSTSVARDSLSRFHRRLLRRFDYDSLDLNDAGFQIISGAIDPRFFSQHRVIVVHSSEFVNSYFRDNPSFLTYFNDFLKAGGKLVVAGHFPFSGGAQNSELCYHDPFLTGNTTREAWEETRNLFGFDCLFFPLFYFTDSSLATHSFLHANPKETGYPQLQADSARVDLFVRTFPLDRHYQYPTVPNVGYLTNRGSGEDLYSFGSILGGVDDKHGQTVAKKHIDPNGGGFVWFNFPLYFMKEDSAKKAFLLAMADLGVPEDFPKGDINLDGMRSLPDLIYFLDYVFAGTPFVEFDTSEIDMNCDGEVGPSDIILFLLDYYEVQPLSCN